MVHAHCIISLFSLISSLLSSVFSLIFFFSFFLLCFLLLCEYTLFFDPVFRARRGPFYSACRGQCFTSFPLSPPLNHTPFTFYLWPMAPPHPILARYRLVVPEPCTCFPLRYIQKSACYSCVCRDLETLRPCFLTFCVGFSLLSHSIQEVDFV